MPVFERQQNRSQRSSHLASPVRLDRADSRIAPMRNSFIAQQQSLGNQAVQRLLRSRVIQTKLTINDPRDRYEQEADRVADAVMRMPDPSATRGTAVSEQTQGLDIQRMCSECEEELRPQPTKEEKKEEILQAKEVAADHTTAQATPDMQSQLSVVRSGGGNPLPESVRCFFEPRFGYDFSQVRIHTDARAAESARAVNAAAYTVGRDIVFDAGHYAPGIASGRALLAHELVHVVQQGESRESAGVGQIDGEAKVRRQAVSVPATEYRFAAEGVSVLVRTSCAGPNFGHATVEAAVRDVLDKVFNTDCIALNRRRQIQRNLRTNGLDLICRRSASIGGNCARGEGFSTPANQIALGSEGFPGHPDYDASGCGPLASTILHEIIHITRGTFPEALPSSCEASCYGFGSADPALCRGPVTPPSPVPVGFESSQMELA